MPLLHTFLYLHLPCVSPSASCCLAYLPLPLPPIHTFLYLYLPSIPSSPSTSHPCRPLLPTPLRASSLTLSASYLSRTQVLLPLLLLLLSFPLFPTPFSSGVVPNGSTLVGLGSWKGRDGEREVQEKKRDVISVLVSLCLPPPPLHGSFSFFLVICG